MPLSAILLLAACLCAIGHQLAPGWPWMDGAAGIGLTLYLLLEWRDLRRPAQVILILGGLLSALTLGMMDQPWTRLAQAAAHAASLAGLFVALGFLREAAGQSPLVLAAGQALVAQPPGRRYMALSLGSHLISLVLNFGVLSLLGTMVMRGNDLHAAGGDQTIVDIRSRRMLSAILQGFAAMTIWSPLSVSFTVVSGQLTGIRLMDLLPLQIILTLLVMGIGWYLDHRLIRPPLSIQPRQTTASVAPVLRLSILILGVMGSAVAMAAILSVPILLGAMLAVPPAALIWLWAQKGRQAPRFLMGRLAISLPAFRDELAMICGAMFFGTLAGALMPADMLAHLVTQSPLSPAWMAVAMSWSVIFLAHLGLSQIVTVTLLGGIITHLPPGALPLLPLASGLMAAWALSICTTPVGAAVLTVARLAERPVPIIARQWNGAFVAISASIVGLWVLALSIILDFP